MKLERQIDQSVTGEAFLDDNLEDFPNDALFDESEQDDSDDTSFEITDVYPGKTFNNSNTVNELQPKL